MSLAIFISKTEKETHSGRRNHFHFLSHLKSDGREKKSLSLLSLTLSITLQQTDGRERT